MFSAGLVVVVWFMMVVRQKSSPWPILFLLVVFGLGVGSLGRAWFELVWLRQAGVTVEGEVVDRAQLAKSPRQVTYEYGVVRPDGSQETLSDTRFVSQEVYSAAYPGEPISVVYIPAHPTVSNIANNRQTGVGNIWLATVIGLVVEGFVGLLLVLHLMDNVKDRSSLTPSEK